MYLFICQNDSFVKLFKENYEQNKSHLNYEAKFIPLLHKLIATDADTAKCQNDILNEIKSLGNDFQIVNVCSNDIGSLYHFFHTVSKIFETNGIEDAKIHFCNVDINDSDCIDKTIKSFS